MSLTAIFGVIVFFGALWAALVCPRDRQNRPARAFRRSKWTPGCLEPTLIVQHTIWTPR